MSERVRTESVPRIKVSLGDQVVADTSRGYVVHEQGLPPRYYIPRADIRAELSPGAGAGTCPWKGEWKHLNVSVGDAAIPNGAWTYFESKPATEQTKDCVAFYESKFTIDAG